MTEVVAHQCLGFGLYGELDEGFIIRVVENGNPSVGSWVAFRQRAQGVQQSVDFHEVEVKGGGFAFEDLLVFRDGGLAEDERPAPLPERVEQLPCRERRAA